MTAPTPPDVEGHDVTRLRGVWTCTCGDGGGSGHTDQVSIESQISCHLEDAAWRASLPTLPLPVLLDQYGTARQVRTRIGPKGTTSTRVHGQERSQQLRAEIDRRVEALAAAPSGETAPPPGLLSQITAYQRVLAVNLEDMAATVEAMSSVLPSEELVAVGDAATSADSVDVLPLSTIRAELVAYHAVVVMAGMTPDDDPAAEMAYDLIDKTAGDLASAVVYRVSPVRMARKVVAARQAESGTSTQAPPGASGWSTAEQAALNTWTRGAGDPSDTAPMLDAVRAALRVAGTNAVATPATLDAAYGAAAQALSRYDQHNGLSTADHPTRHQRAEARVAVDAAIPHLAAAVPARTNAQATPTIPVAAIQPELDDFTAALAANDALGDGPHADYVVRTSEERMEAAAWELAMKLHDALRAAAPSGEQPTTEPPRVTLPDELFADQPPDPIAVERQRQDRIDWPGLIADAATPRTQPVGEVPDHG